MPFCAGAQRRIVAGAHLPAWSLSCGAGQSHAAREPLCPPRTGSHAAPGGGWQRHGGACRSAARSWQAGMGAATHRTRSACPVGEARAVARFVQLLRARGGCGGRLPGGAPWGCRPGPVGGRRQPPRSCRPPGPLRRTPPGPKSVPAGHACVRLPGVGVTGTADCACTGLVFVGHVAGSGAAQVCVDRPAPVPICRPGCAQRSG